VGERVNQGNPTDLVRELDAGNLHVQFDERGVETEWDPDLDHRVTPRLYSPGRVPTCPGIGGPRQCDFRLAEGRPLSSLSDEPEFSSASLSSRIGRRRILAGISVAKPVNWSAFRLTAVLWTTTQILLSEMLTIDIGSLRFSRRRVTYPRPLLTQVFAIQWVTTQEVEAAGIAPVSFIRRRHHPETNHRSWGEHRLWINDSQIPVHKQEGRTALNRQWNAPISSTVLHAAKSEQLIYRQWLMINISFSWC